MATPFIGYWRDGKRLAMDRNAVLPDRCIKCDDAAEGYRRRMTFQYVNTAAHLAVGAFAYAFAKRATVEIPLCPRHRRSNALNIGLGSVAVLVLSFAVLSQPGQTNMILLLLGVAGLVGGVAGILYALLRRTIRASKITDTHVWLTGAGEPFLASIPSAPTLAAEQPLPTLATPAPTPVDPAAAADLAYRNVRNGALTFAIGAVVTLVTYVALTGTYFIAWGPIAFGLYRLLAGARPYLAVPVALRTTTQVLTLGALVAVGAVAGGWVVFQEYEADQFGNAVTAAAVPQKAASSLFTEVVNRKGAWTSADATDMTRVAQSYGEAADILARSTPPVAVAWYRDGMVKNFREAADIATGLSRLTSSSPQSAFDALGRRWSARVDDFNALQARLNTQVK